MLIDAAASADFCQGACRPRPEANRASGGLTSKPRGFDPRFYA